MSGLDLHLDEIAIASMDPIVCEFRPLSRHSVQAHQHPEVEWHYILAGHCDFRFADGKQRIVAGDLFAVPAGLAHGVHIHRPGDFILQYIYFCAQPASQLHRAWFDRFGHECIAIGAGRHAFFDRLARDSRHHDPWRQQAASARFTALICDLLADNPADAVAHPAVERALACMRHQLHAPLSLDAMARAAQVDKHYPSRLFRRDMGCAPVHYHCRLRLELAASMLRDDDASISTIATAIGFDDPFHFSRRFRAHSGYSPSAYRAAHRDL
ncbi:MAG: helix-turn-helix domain-containing protein [Planctomycetota bacterium]